MFKRSLFLSMVLVLLLGSFPLAPAFASSSSTTHQTFNVLVGLENTYKGVDVEAYFPSTVYIHPGDTVHWIINSYEIHTVTFLYGAVPPNLAIILPAPAGSPSPLMFNPAVVIPTVPNGGQYDGTTFANSGLMGLAPGQQKTFNLTFTQTGTFEYTCIVHGADMSGKVVVVPDGTPIPTPDQVSAQGKMQMAQKLSQVPAVFRHADALIKPPEKNPDGTLTYHVMMGYSEGNIDLMDFFPSNLTVHTGDTVIWGFPPNPEAPHTVTFLNGASAPSLVIPGTLFINPAVLSPSKMGEPLTRQGVYNSGLLNPLVPGPHQYSLKIGNITGLVNYLCLVHDESGMTGTLTVVPR